MAKNSTDTTPVTSGDLNLTAARVVDEAPKLPTADIDTEPAAPTIDTALIAQRDAEAKAQAERIAKAQGK